MTMAAARQIGTGDTVIAVGALRQIGGEKIEIPAVARQSVDAYDCPAGLGMAPLAVSDAVKAMRPKA